ncbi:RNA polymerase sigma-54 factor [Aureimonas glaciei]|jgi:RNA polymerase sigma-54 factor|uniref:RNA polymerase sigma-54 factor n=2 Tax=Aureimonas glaciei TaxID=1776957 RepID=A0A916XRQ8_9HYPH|nr:RNA polymerase sigma-54 factor [Aureimonas glaciei]
MLSAKLQMRQSQSLVMTPQLLQSIRLLQFSHLELQTFIEGEMEKNPLLSVAETRPDDPRAEHQAPALVPDLDDAALDQAGERAEIAGFDDGFDPPAARATPEEGRPLPSQLPSSGIGGQEGESFIEALADTKPSLFAHALSEIRQAIVDPADRRIAEILAEQLDEGGYLRLDIAAAAAELGIDARRATSILDRLKNEAEPAGLFAQDLADCLAIQLRRRNRLDPVMQIVLDNLDLLARRDFQALRRLTGEDESGLMDMLAEIRRLDPKPGQDYGSAVADVVVPDVIVEAAVDGGWRIELNPAALPRVLVESDYVRRIATGRLDKQEQAFISDCHASANWLVRSLDQRARTILKVATEIVKHQDGFLCEGITALRPLTLMTVAEAVGMHESTISRVTANKYIATPRGTFELKFFFTVAIPATGGGEAHSAETVKHRIRSMVDGESAGCVLSDDDIAERLKREGVDLARRTVAKYREGLGIRSSIQRRREMKARQLAC